MENLFKYDVYRKLQKYKVTKIDLFLNRDLKCLKAFRYAQYYSGKKGLLKLFKFFYLLKLKIYCNKYDFNVSYKAQIGKGLFIGHNGPIIINGGAKIGENCNIATGVTIGQENRGKRKGCPIIGNKVWIGTNSTIVGNIKIGNNVMISPNSFINFDVPDNSIVIGNTSSKVIYSDKAVDEYINDVI